MTSDAKIIFANQLRGIAALFVVLAHLGYVFWMARGTVANFIGADAIEGPAPFGIQILVSDYLNLGVLGVALFFLLSGFVIPFSLKKTGQFRFILARIFRIYPTYVCGLLMGLFAVWLSSMYWGKPFMWDAQTIIQNMALVHTLTGVQSIDLVNWTLAIELKFYITMCVMAVFLKRGAVWPFISFALAVLALNKHQQTAVGTELAFVGFMFIGVFFYYRLCGLIGRLKLLLSVAAMLAIFFAGWSSTPWPTMFMQVAPNYLYGIALFGLSFLFRYKFKRVRILDFLADVSYPLYITHSLVGYSFMRILFEEGVRYRYIVPLTLVLVTAIAFALHKLIENPSVQLGRNITRPAQQIPNTVEQLLP
jgi:peptidoglycan/LPS O-acetylase OafA/YrhL